MEKNKQNWLQQGSMLNIIGSNAKILNELPVGIYNLQQNNRTMEFYLTHLSDKFEFPFKIYDIDNKFIKHVMTTYHNTTNNLGVLLSGLKGTGKTVTSKILVNEMNLPCIIISQNYEGLQDFLASLECECILMFDEFEKNFENQTQDLLSVMDGVYNSLTRKIFLLTTNTLHINDNFLSRPSRIRYKKTYTNLPIETVISYLNDNLVDKTKIKEIVEFVNTLACSTIDIVKCITDEINLHNCNINDIKDYLNVQVATHIYKTIVSFRATSIEEFKEQLNHAESLIGTTHETEGWKYESIEDVDGFHVEVAATSHPVFYIERGEDFGSRYVVEEQINTDGIIKLKSKYDNAVRYAKVMNVNEKPTLYGDKFNALHLAL